MKRTFVLLCFVLLFAACGRGLVDESYSVKFVGLQPQVGPTTGGTRVTLYGQNLHNQLAIFLGDQRIEDFTLQTDSTIEFTLPASKKLGPVKLRVENLLTKNVWSQSNGFRYRAETLRYQFGEQLGLSDSYTVFAGADINKDGTMDVVKATALGLQGGALTYFIKKADGFQERETYTLPWKVDFTSRTNEPSQSQMCVSLVVGDFNGDGWPDAVSAYTDNQELMLFLGDGKGGLKKGVSIKFPKKIEPYLHRELRVVDLNGDGTDELLTIHYVRRGFQDINTNILGKVIVWSALGTKQPKVSELSQSHCSYLHSYLLPSAQPVAGKPLDLWMLCSDKDSKLKQLHITMSSNFSLQVKEAKLLLKEPIGEEKYYLFDLDADGSFEYVKVIHNTPNLCVHKGEVSKSGGLSFVKNDTLCTAINYYTSSKMSTALMARNIRGNKTKELLFVRRDGIEFFDWNEDMYGWQHLQFSTQSVSGKRMGYDFSRGDRYGPQIPHVLLQDFNKDGYADLLATDETGRTFLVYAGSAAFVRLVPQFSIVGKEKEDRALSLLHEDINQDGHYDTIALFEIETSDLEKGNMRLRISYGGPNPPPTQWMTFRFGQCAACLGNPNCSCGGGGIYPTPRIRLLSWQGKQKDILIQYDNSGQVLELYYFKFKGKEYTSKPLVYRSPFTSRQQVPLLTKLEVDKETNKLSVATKTFVYGKGSYRIESREYSVNASFQFVESKEKRAARDLGDGVAFMGDVDGDGVLDYIQRNGLYCPGSMEEKCALSSSYRPLCERGPCTLYTYTPLCGGRGCYSSFEQNFMYRPLVQGKLIHSFAALSTQRKIVWLTHQEGKKVSESVISYDAFGQHDPYVYQHFLCDVDGDGRQDPILLIRNTLVQSVLVYALFKNKSGAVRASYLGHTKSNIYRIQCMSRSGGALQDLGMWTLQSNNSNHNYDSHRFSYNTIQNTSY